MPKAQSGAWEEHVYWNYGGSGIEWESIRDAFGPRSQLVQKRGKKICYPRVNPKLTFMHAPRQLCITFMHITFTRFLENLGVNSHPRHGITANFCTRLALQVRIGNRVASVLANRRFEIIQTLGCNRMAPQKRECYNRQ